MCLCRKKSINPKLQGGRPRSGRGLRSRKGEAVPSGGTPRAGRIVPAPSALAGGIVVALACIVGSEPERARLPRALQTTRAATPFLDSLPLFFDNFHWQPRAGPTTLLTGEQRDAYARDGFVVVSGLLNGDELSGLVDAGEGLISKQAEKAGGKLPSRGNFQLHEFGLALHDKRFRDVALRSRLPRAAAELMQLDGETQNLRVLRDVFLAKGHESTSSCGWHVDDQMFWPAAYQLPRPSQVDQNGTNAWIALDDMPIDGGGSMAVSPGSHSQDFSWRSDALSALNFKEEFGNGVSKEDLFEMIRTGRVDSCGLEKFAPHVYDDIELSKQELDIKKGDVIFMNRWLFHKSTDLTGRGKAALRALEGDSEGAALLKRYSVRFATGDTSLPEGFVTEMSVLASDGSNAGRTLDEVSGEWYPKCWPRVDADVDDRMDRLVAREVPMAQERLGAIMAEAMKVFQSK